MFGMFNINGGAAVEKQQHLPKILGRLSAPQVDIPSGNLLQFDIENGHGLLDLPIKNGDVPQLCKRLPEGKHQTMGISS